MTVLSPRFIAVLIITAAAALCTTDASARTDDARVHAHRHAHRVHHAHHAHHASHRHHHRHHHAH